ncbi:hypothetical protein A5634_22300 [Mycobacterium asiaticum]|uniref:AAA+ ATPase domain-containing protein n=1 Tax=Mycobacterium asiaticum TaxID=1790 RepID=A0A1A3P0J0_MYCAS|nr:AAA family ATPase [Mycobacterium asiaticum]OBK27701.1 hypothetical protein A5634_22300 [Mycobacterium asiaticum]
MSTNDEGHPDDEYGRPSVDSSGESGHQPIRSGDAGQSDDAPFIRYAIEQASRNPDTYAKSSRECQRKADRLRAQRGDPPWGDDFIDHFSLPRFAGKPKPDRRPRPSLVAVPTPPDGARWGRWALATVEAKCARIAATPEGSRNHALNAEGVRALRVAMRGELDLAAVTEALAAAGRAAGLGEGEVRATLSSASAKADNDGPADPPPDREWPAVATSFTVDPAAITGDGPADPVDRQRFVSGGAFILDAPEEPPAIWGHGGDVLWARGESLMVAGPMGVGKTTLAGLLIRALLGLGDGTVLGLPVVALAPDRRLLYLAMDRPRQAARSLARQFGAADREVLDERLVVWPGPPPADVARHPEVLTLLAEDADAAVVVLDSVKDAAIGLSEDEVGAGYNRARQMLLASGRELAELHHTTKRGANGGPPTQAQDIYGSTWITNGTGSILLLSGEPGDPLVHCRHVRQPMNELGPWWLSHDQDSGALTVHHAVDLVVLAAASPDGVTAKAAAAAIFCDADEDGDKLPKPKPGQVEKARRQLDMKTKAGLLIRVEGSKGGTAGGKPTAWFPAPSGVATVFP